VSRRALAWSVALVLSVALQLASEKQAARTASGPSFTLRLDSGAAPLIDGKRVAALEQGMRVLGPPARVSFISGSSPRCRAIWPTLGLTIDFASRQPPSCAAPALGSWIAMTASDPRWHSSGGLRVGDPASRLRGLYPTAHRLGFLGQGDLWEIETGGPLCDGGPPIALGGRILSNRVVSLVIVHVPACG